ncbi:MAG: hypothetical protein ACMX3H_14500 [Sodalis sp. (in: enterobacteria)]|uniref:hypothetical protein n=1 Tax=Sodalis sp. (in: enterobacteria) TaxID=1898979 RepID=UPI0039E5B2A6
MPRIKKAFPNLSDEGVQLKIGGLFSNRTASDLFATMYNQRENIQKQLLAGTQAQDIDTLLRQGQHTAGGQELILEAKKHDLYKNIGEKVLPLYVKGLEKVSAMLDRVNAFFARHQQAAKVLTVTAAGFGLLLTAGAAVLIWQNWDTLGPKFKALWESVSQTTREKWQAIQDYLQALPGRRRPDDGRHVVRPGSGAAASLQPAGQPLPRPAGHGGPRWWRDPHQH